MITSEEERRIIQKAKEEILLTLPEAMAALVRDNATHVEMRNEFYKQHPEFKGHEFIVAEIIEDLERKNPRWDYPELLKNAVPVIKERLEEMSKYDYSKPQRPDRRFHE